MSDPLRTDASRTADAGLAMAREAKVEQLLLDGLDHYLAARFEQAINVWTRALFIDRNHPRARAYIERARSALAERQRESEELLQVVLGALNRGDSAEARRLLQDLLSRGAPSDEALALRERLDRIALDPAPRPVAPARALRRRPAMWPPATRLRGPFTSAWAWLALAALLVTAGAWVTVATGRGWGATLTLAPAGPPAPSTIGAAEPAFPVPRRGEMALARARSLAAGGHLQDALQALDSVKDTDIHKVDADRLRAGIQRQLIALTVMSDEPQPEDPSSRTP